MPDFYQEGNLIVRTESYNSDPEPEPEPDPETEVLSEAWKEKVTGNNNPKELKKEDFPKLS